MQLKNNHNGARGVHQRRHAMPRRTHRLAIAEALIIKDGTPAISLQATGFVRTLRLFSVEFFGALILDTYLCDFVTISINFDF
jgi:hypothetical protein